MKLHKVLKQGAKSTLHKHSYTHCSSGATRQKINVRFNSISYVICKSEIKAVVKSLNRGRCCVVCHVCGSCEKGAMLQTKTEGNLLQHSCFTHSQTCCTGGLHLRSDLHTGNRSREWRHHENTLAYTGDELHSS